MATIASLAIKVSANIADLTKSFNTINSSIGYMVKTAQNASPSLKSLEDASRGLAASENAVAESAKRMNAAVMTDKFDEARGVFYRTGQAAEQLRTELDRIGKGVSGDILNMQPSLKNIGKAQEMVQKLKETFGETSPIVEEAQRNVGLLATRAAESEMQMEGLKATMFAINQLPFTILTSVFKDLWGHVANIGSEFNERWNGLPGIILKTSTVVGALIVVLGLALTKMTALNAQVTYFQALWKSSLIVQGITAFYTCLLSLLGVQIGLNVATVFWVSMITLGLAAVIAAVVALVSWWWNSGKAVEDNETKIKMMEAAAKDFRDRIAESADRFKELNRLAKQYHDANLTGAQIYENKLKEIEAVRNRKNAADEMIRDLNLKEIDLVKALDKAKDKKQIESIQKQLDDIRADRSAIAKDIRNAPVVSEAGLQAAETAARMEYLKNQYGNLLEKTLTAQEEYNQTMNKVRADQILGQDAILVEVAARKKLAEGLKKEADELAQRLGIADYLKADKPAGLTEVYAKLEQFYNSGMKADIDLIEAKKRAKDALEKQSEMYNLYQKAQDAMLTAQQKIDAAKVKIMEEAAKFSWNKDVVDKMLEMSAAEIDKEKTDNAGKSKDNQAIVRGTIAYTDFQNKNTGNDHLKIIRDASKKHNELLAKNIEATKETGNVFKQCFEVVS